MSLNNLKLDANISDYDAVYQLIIDMHKGLNDEESQLANAKLILTLANHIGSTQILSQATLLVRQNTISWRDEE